MNNEYIVKELEKLPDEVADALLVWRKATAERERVEGYAHLKLKAEASAFGDRLTVKDLKAKVLQDVEVSNAILAEIMAETTHMRLYERLMALKKTATIRGAF